MSKLGFATFVAAVGVIAAGRWLFKLDRDLRRPYKATTYTDPVVGE